MAEHRKKFTENILYTHSAAFRQQKHIIIDERKRESSKAQGEQDTEQYNRNLWHFFQVNGKFE